MSLGGAETLIMCIYRHIDRTKVQFDFLLHNPEKSAYEDEIVSLGGHIYKIPRFTGFNGISYGKSLTEFLLNHPEHIIIHDHLMDSASKTLNIANCLGRVSVAHSHIAGLPFSIENLIRFQFRKNLWKIAEYRFACSNEAGLWLFRNKAPFSILRNGIDTQRFKFEKTKRSEIRSKLGIAKGKTVIGNVGRMVDQKNQIRLLEIFAEYKKEFDSESLLLIIGEGQLKSQIEKRIEDLGLTDNVLLTGPRKDINELMMAMDCFVLTSLYEGLGIVLVEAQASGLPCIFTNTIPTEVNIIPSLVHRVKLKDSDSMWARTIQDSIPTEERGSCWMEVRKEGYDITETAEQLQNFYLTAKSSRK